MANNSGRIRWVWAAGAVLLLAAGPGERGRAEAPKVSPFKEPLALMHRAKAAYAKVDDYTCLLIKREKLGDKMTPDNVIEMKLRKSPFSVAMKWQQPKSLSGQEAYYVAGLHDGKMRAKPAGFLGAIGYITIPVDDARAKKTARHPITCAGIGHAIEEAVRNWEADLKSGASATVKIDTYTYAKRKCTRLEISYPERGKRNYAKNIFYFDQATHLPIRVENFAWPAKAGGQPELVEVYSYVNMRLNVGLTDATFKK
jgi:hypothetical protein